jgi:hypothetical protein
VGLLGYDDPESFRLVTATRREKMMAKQDLIRKLSGANMDIDLVTPAEDISWMQTACPWNATEGVRNHRCAVKNESICPFFCGIEYLDIVVCCYPNANPYSDTF